MNKYIPFLLCLIGFLFLSFLAQGQEYRTIDGSNNNLQNPDYGAAFSQMKTLVSNGFTDQYSTPAGMDRPNPRLVSNEIFAQSGLLPDPFNVSDYTWVFGQFVDHDITFVLDGIEFLPIAVPNGDLWFDCNGTGSMIIPMNRSSFDGTTGTDPGNPRKYLNSITGWIDGSAIYGSDDDRANWLRTFQDGKLKVSAGNLLPYNTFNGELSDDIDPDAPHMDNPTMISDKVFVAGDARGNENPLLTSFHTLFMREHNRMCDSILTKNPTWTDEEIYQHARKYVGGFLASIVYNEWLPAMGIDVPKYHGYNQNIDGRVSNMFSAAAFRLGHTMLNSLILRNDMDGNTVPQGNLELKFGFFNPPAIPDVGGIGPYIKGMGIQPAQTLDSKVIDDVRNFLFGPPCNGGLDLASININRGRDRGLPDFNTIRVDLGLSPYNSIAEISSNTDLVNKLIQLYGTVDKIDPWVGMLSEDPLPSTIFGSTLQKIMYDQFMDLRDGDRFFYLNDPDLTQREKAEIHHTRLIDIIRRNLDIPIMQDDVFQAMDHNQIPICDAGIVEADISGDVQMPNGTGVNNVTMQLFNGQTMMPDETTAYGNYNFQDATTCKDYVVIPYCNDDADNGVTTFDMIKVQKHILELEFLNSPYKIIAADVNNTGDVSIFDLIEMRNIVLHITDEFTNNYSWRFIDADYTFDNEINPLQENFDEVGFLDMLSQDETVDFVAIKTGDVDYSANPSNVITIEDNSLEDMVYLRAKNQPLTKGEYIQVSFEIPDLEMLQGLQYTFNYDEDILSFEQITSDHSSFSKDNFFVMESVGAITSSWFTLDEISAEGTAFTISFSVNQSGYELKDLLNINSRYTDALAMDRADEQYSVGLQFAETASLNQPFMVYQNTPNPAISQTSISYSLPAPGKVQVVFSDELGRHIKTLVMEGQSGYNVLPVSKEELAIENGLVTYTVQTPFGAKTRKIVWIR